MEKTALEPGNYYHIYHGGNNGQDLFFYPENYVFFLQRYHQYISPFCDTLAWVLLKNHFHLLIYVRPRNEILLNQLKYSATAIPKRIDVHLQFGHLFNSYAKAINKRYHRTGSLFEKKFERTLLPDERYLKEVILYIHYNPVEHLFTTAIPAYRWSSYATILSSQCTNLKREFVLELFQNREKFQLFHQKKPDFEFIKKLIP